MSHYAYQGEFIRGKDSVSSTPYCVSIYRTDQRFDELPHQGEAAYWCKTQMEAIDYVRDHMKQQNIHKYTYVIRCLEVTHIG